MRAQLAVRIFQRDRDHSDVRRVLRVRLAAETLAVAAVLAGAELRAVRVGVGARRIGRRPRERVIPQVLRRGREHLARKDRGEWRQRVFAGTRRFEGVAAGLYLALDVAGLAGDRRGGFELVVIGVEFVVSDAPVL